MSDFEPRIDSSNARTDGDVVVPAPLADFPDLVLRVVSRDDHYKVKSSSADGVEISRRINWLTWGEVLTLTFDRAGDNQTVVAVQSQPTFSLQAYDWGQSEKDVRDLLQAIWAEASSGADQP